MNDKYKEKNLEKLDDLLDKDKKEDVFLDENHINKKGDPRKDIRFDTNLNDKELDVVSKKNQLR